MFHNLELARRARFQGNGTGRMIPKGMPESRVIVHTAADDRFIIEGHISPGFESVRDAFADNFVRRRELGGACCAFNGGDKVVDLWGGIRNKETGEPWEKDTMVIVYSATKAWQL